MAIRVNDFIVWRKHRHVHDAHCDLLRSIYIYMSSRWNSKKRTIANGQRTVTENTVLGPKNEAGGSNCEQEIFSKHPFEFDCRFQQTVDLVMAAWKRQKEITITDVFYLFIIIFLWRVNFRGSVRLPGTRRFAPNATGRRLSPFTFERLFFPINLNRSRDTVML